jgi:valyl-tRNA synthetase
VSAPDSPQEGVVPVVVGTITLNLHLGDVINMEEAYALLHQKGQALDKEMDRLSKKLENQAYKNAKPDQWAEDEILYMQKQKEYAKIKDLKVINT